MSDYIDGYKQGFKEGVQEFQIQLKSLHEKGKGKIIQNGEYILPDLIVISKQSIDEICKELTGDIEQ